MAYAHAHGVIHRDLKPANVMVGAFGEVQVMDWGLAKVLGDRRPASPEMTAAETRLTEIRSPADADAATQAGSMLGTPAFMPPEQAGGEIGKVDERADVFGLGAVLCTILTGETAIFWNGFRRSSIDGDSWRDSRGCRTAGLVRCRTGLGGAGEAMPLGEPRRTAKRSGEVAKAVRAHLAEAEERVHRAELERVRAEGECAKAEAEAPRAA